MAKKAKHVVADETEDNNATEMETASPVKVKKEKDTPSYDELLNHVSVIAKPMASRKLTKKIYKLLKKGWFHFNRFILIIALMKLKNSNSSFFTERFCQKWIERCSKANQIGRKRVTFCQPCATISFNNNLGCLFFLFIGWSFLQVM